MAKKVISKKGTSGKVEVKKGVAQKVAGEVTSEKLKVKKGVAQKVASKKVAEEVTSEKLKVKKGIAKKAAVKKSVTNIKPVALKKEAVKKVLLKKNLLVKQEISDDTIDIEQFDKEHNAHIPFEKKVSRGSIAAVVSACPQGKQPKVIRDNPHTSPAVNPANYITNLNVTLSKQNLEVKWLDGKIENWLCSPNPKLTPKINDVVGIKCGPKHTNFKKDGMAWFTALKSKGMVYGFHNSQRVGLGIVSHGCIRVSCEHAKTINQHSWSGKTKIKITK